MAGLLISAVGALWLARGMVRPIRTLDEGARRIGAGDLDQQIVVRTGDELEGLADQFNRMTAQLRESYAGLERKVEERTRELTDPLEQQTAISEILRVICSSPTDVQPMLEAIAERAAQALRRVGGVVYLIDGDTLQHCWRRRGRRRSRCGTSRPCRSIANRSPVARSDGANERSRCPDLLAAGADYPLSHDIAERFDTARARHPAVSRGQAVRHDPAAAP